MSLRFRFSCFPSDFLRHSLGGQSKAVQSEGPGGQRRGTPDDLIKCCMKGLIGLLPLPQSSTLSSLGTSQANSGNIYHVYSAPQTPSFAWNMFLVFLHPSRSPSKHIILLVPHYLLCIKCLKWYLYIILNNLNTYSLIYMCLPRKSHVNSICFKHSV